jgi:hypothetical protein
MSPQSQKQAFEKAFKELLSQAPDNIRAEWNGDIAWVDLPGTNASQPLVTDIANKFPKALKDQYVTLINNLKNHHI